MIFLQPPNYIPRQRQIPRGRPTDIYANGEMLRKGKTVKKTILIIGVLLAFAVMAQLAAPTLRVEAKKPDPTVQAFRIGSTGGGDGNVSFTVDNTGGTLALTTFKITVTSGDEIRAIIGTPTNWSSSAILFNNGKAVTEIWSTTTAPVAGGSTLGGFAAKMSGQSPYVYSWVLTNTSGQTSSGSVSVS
jgi:hypothetical protein